MRWFEPIYSLQDNLLKLKYISEGAQANYDLKPVLALDDPDNLYIN